jgi:hypothetical protein
MPAQDTYRLIYLASQTHNVALAAPIADFTISIGLNGRILSQGSVAEALQHDFKLAEEANAALQVMEQVVDAEPVEVIADTAAADSKTDGKLILAEEVQLGRVKWSAGEWFHAAPQASAHCWFQWVSIFGVWEALDFTPSLSDSILFRTWLRSTKHGISATSHRCTRRVQRVRFRCPSEFFVG